MAQPRGHCLIAGKGHEKYQEFSDHTVPFDDVEFAGRALEETRWSYQIMDPRSIEHIAKWVEAKFHGPGVGQVTSVVTDSRSIRPGEFFVALRGDHFDGHTFLRQSGRPEQSELW